MSHAGNAPAAGDAGGAQAVGFGLLLGDVAVDKGFITPEQLREALDIQQRLPEHYPLGFILTSKKFLDEESLDHLLELQRTYLELASAQTRERVEDRYFGRLAVREGVVAPEQLHRALRRQAMLEADGTSLRLGEVMVKEGLLSVEQVVRLLEKQRISILVCPSCLRQYNVRDRSPEARYRCKCGQTLILPERVYSIRVEGPAELDTGAADAPEHTEDAGAVGDTVTRLAIVELAEQPTRAVGPPEAGGERENGNGDGNGNEHGDGPGGDGAEDATRTRIGGGARFLQYEILHKDMARGGMGVVHKAFHPGLKRVVIIKQMLNADGGGEMLRRFQREPELMARLRHPGIVQILDAGESEGRPYFVMEFVGGGSLADRLRRDGVLPPRDAADLVRQVAEAVDLAHREGVVHRDLKPDNILLDEVGRPRVTDFGIAKRMEGDAHTLQTQEGMVIGTLRYMPPEQAAGETEHTGPHSDVYAMGAVLYQLLAGRTPFGDDPQQSAMAILRDVLYKEPDPPRQHRPELHRDLETITLKCLQKESERRYGSAQALADDLRRFLDGEPIHARPPTRTERLSRWVRRNKALAAAVLVAGLSLGGAGAYLAADTWARWSKVDQAVRDGDRLLEATLDEQALDQARDAYNRALAEDPGNKDASRGLSRVEEHRARLVVEQGRAAADARAAEGRDLLEAGQAQQARDAFLAARSLDPEPRRTDYFADLVRQADATLSRVAEEERRVQDQTEAGLLVANASIELKRALDEHGVDTNAFLHVMTAYEQALSRVPGHRGAIQGKYDLHVEWGRRALADNNWGLAEYMFGAAAALPVDDESARSAAGLRDDASRKRQGWDALQATLRSARDALAMGRYEEAQAACDQAAEAAQPFRDRDVDDEIRKLRDDARVAEATVKLRQGARAGDAGAVAGGLEVVSRLAEDRLDALRSEALDLLLPALERQADDPSTDRPALARRLDALLAVALDPRVQRLRDRVLALEHTPEGMLYVDGGEYTPGSPDPRDGNPPGVPAELAGFYLDRFEVTCRDYQRFVDDRGYERDEFWPPGAPRETFRDRTGMSGPAGWAGGRAPEGAAMFPVTGVSLHEAMAYARWAGKRLLTETEWEYAATAGQGAARPYPWGAEWDPGLANLGGGQVGPVDLYPGDATPHGVRGLAGNVSEWTLGVSGQGVVRGGSALAPVQAKLMARNYRRVQAPDPAWRSDALGFRCARDIQLQEGAGR